MWHGLEDERFVRREIDPLRLTGTVLDTPTDGDEKVLSMRRWVHDDGRYAVHVPDADPELLVLDADGVVIREYDLPGEGKGPGLADPLRGARMVRAVAATAAEDAPTPALGDGEARWALLRGWS